MPQSRKPDTPGINDPGPGRRLALDVGTARIGVAVSDSMGMLATPVETVTRATRVGAADDGADLDRLVHLVEQYRPVEIIIGLPRNLKNEGSRSVTEAEFIGDRLMARLGNQPVPVRYADERLTTALATRALQASGVSSKKGRGVIDQAAAVEILQTWLDGRSRAGH